jgi:hypothetical protein
MKCFGIASTGIVFRENHKKEDLITIAKFFGYNDRHRTVLERFKKMAFRKWIPKHGKALRRRNFVRLFKKREQSAKRFIIPEEEADLWKEWSETEL